MEEMTPMQILRDIRECVCEVIEGVERDTTKNHNTEGNFNGYVISEEKKMYSVMRAFLQDIRELREMTDDQYEAPREWWWGSWTEDDGFLIYPCLNGWQRQLETHMDQGKRIFMPIMAVGPEEAAGRFYAQTQTGNATAILAGSNMDFPS